MIAPFIDELSKKYPQVKFLKVRTFLSYFESPIIKHQLQVDTDRNPFAGGLGITSIPTFFFYVNGVKVDEMRGADPRGLEQKILQHKVDITTSFAGKGMTLGSQSPAWDGVGMPPGDNARAARLKAFGAIDQKASKSEANLTTTINDTTATPMETEDDEALAEAIKMSQMEQSTSAAQDAKDDEDAAALVAQGISADQSWGEDMIPVPVDATLLSELVEMGFSDVRARKAIVHGKNIEGALAWLDEHQDDPDIDQPYMVRKDEVKTPLTEEEIARRTLEMKAKIVRLRQEKEREERQRAILSEKERRERGQKMAETQEERDRLMRKREAEKVKKEKEAEKRERERLRAEIARDKELRRQNKGVLPSVLGVDGYNPSIVNYNEPIKGTEGQPEAKVEAKPAVTSSAPRSMESKPALKKEVKVGATTVDTRTPEQQIDAAIETIARYRTGGDGGNALRLLITFVKNIVDNPNEVKYKSINAESSAFKSKLSNIVGPSLLLKGLGFVKVEEEGKYKIER